MMYIGIIIIIFQAIEFFVLKSGISSLIYMAIGILIFFFSFIKNKKMRFALIILSLFIIVIPKFLIESDNIDDKISITLEESYKLIESNSFDKALEILNPLKDANPKIKINMSVCYLALERPEEARAILFDIPETEEYFFNLGMSYYQEEKYEEGIEYFKKALKINSESIENYLYLGESYFRSKKFKEAIYIFKQGTYLKTGLAEVYYHLAKAELSIMNLKDSRKHLDIAYEMDKDKIINKELNKISKSLSYYDDFLKEGDK